MPDGNTIIHFTDLAFNAAFGALSDPAGLRPIVEGVDLSSPFNVYQPGFFSHTRGNLETPGTYVLFLAAVVPGALADGVIGPGDVIGLSTWPITFTSPTDLPPVADAGPDQIGVGVGSTVMLDGSGSFDPEGGPLSFSWSMASRPDGSTAALSDPTACWTARRIRSW